MRVKVSPMHVLGRPLFAHERREREVYVGELKVLENRLHRLGRAVTTATLASVTADTAPPLLELYDVALLWVDEHRIRLRGFEDAGGVQFAQVWDIELT